MGKRRAELGKLGVVGGSSSCSIWGGVYSFLRGVSLDWIYWIQLKLFLANRPHSIFPSVTPSLFEGQKFCERTDDLSYIPIRVSKAVDQDLMMSKGRQ